MRKKERGASIFQYAIVIVCVMLGAVTVFSGFGKHIVSILTQYNDSFSAMSTNASQNLADNVASAKVVVDQTNSTVDGSKLVVSDTTTINPTTTTQIASTSDVDSTSVAGSDTSIDYGSYVNTGISDTYDTSSVVTTNDTPVSNTVPVSVPVSSEPVTTTVQNPTQTEPIDDDAHASNLFSGIIGMIVNVVTSVVNTVSLFDGRG